MKGYRPNSSLLLIHLVIFFSLIVGFTLGQSNAPPASLRDRNYNKRHRIIDWLLTGCDELSPNCGPRHAPHPVEYESYDGWYNNFARPDLGAVDTALLRLLKPAYSDGSYQPAARTANPFTVSDRTMKGENGMLSNGAKTAFLVFFGQQAVEEILDAQRPGCPPEYFNIDVPEGHRYRDHDPKLKVLPFLRSRYDMSTGYSPNNPRQQLNEITPYIDGGLIYGVAKGWADNLRTFKNGSLARRGLLAWHSKLGEGFPAENSHRLPMANPPPPTNHSEFVAADETAHVNRFFKLGNPRGNENPFLLTFGILLYRWHNAVARRLDHYHRDWSDERVFNEARKWVIATYQNIVMYDWLPKWLREEPKLYQGYQGTVDPQVSHVFQSAAMRFGHTLVPSGVYLRNSNRDPDDACGVDSVELDISGTDHGHSIKGVRTCNSYWRSPELFWKNKYNVERFVMGMASQSTEKEDNIIVEDLRGSVFGPLEFSRRDLMAINIQRGRDHGLPDYNFARKAFGLPPLESLEPSEFKRKNRDAAVDDSVLTRLRDTYDSPNETDIWPGGLLETRKYGPGELFTRIIKDQFERIRDGDRFWFENTNNGQFDDSERERISKLRIIDILLSVTDLTFEDIQEDPFTAVHSNNSIKSMRCMDKLSQKQTCRPYLHSADTQCSYLPPLSNSNLEPCTPAKTFDFFSGSEGAYIATFLVVALSSLCLIVTMLCLTKKKQDHRTKQTFKANKKGSDDIGVLAKEKLSPTESRTVEVIFKSDQRRINVSSVGGGLLRTLDFQHLEDMKIRHLADNTKIIIQALHHYDLFLKFSDTHYGRQMMSGIEKFCSDTGIIAEYTVDTFATINKNVTTHDDRARELAAFSRLVLTEAFENTKKTNAMSSILEIASSAKNHHLFSMEITKAELAAELGTPPDTLFMEQLFRIMDKDSNGFILMKEFWDFMLVFARGTPKEKAQLIFNIYDVSRTGLLSSNDLKAVLESMLGSEGKGRDMDALLENIMKSIHMKPGQSIGFDTFYELFASDDSILDKIHLDCKSNAKLSRGFSIYGLKKLTETERNENKDKIETLLEKEDEDYKATMDNTMSFLGAKWDDSVSYLYNHAIYILWKVLYLLVLWLIFAERAYYYSVEREHGGLRRIAGYGVTVTRGAASAMMFTYSTLLLTMCRNLFTLIRSSFLHRYLPIDEMVSFHRFIGGWALVFTIVHIIGHAINFYHIATQTPSDLSCLFRDFYRSTHVLPKFQYWCWETITGLTGVLLTLQFVVIYVFAYFSRRQFFQLFWLTHNSYPLFYLLTILHGSGNLVQPPFFHYFFLGPVILFILDKLISISVSTVKIDVLEAQHLPSMVTLLKIRRPPNFTYQAGQWIRIASLGISNKEYHPFTLSSAPHEEHLTLHIRAVGPWTTRLRKEYPDISTVASTTGFKYPKIYMDGPFGEGHQRWWEYDVSILVGGGIGVTPFASILKHIAHRSQQPDFAPNTKRVLFLWVTSSQKQFEWLTEILKYVEEQDTRGLIRNHIFITQFKNKYDLRTIFLYMAERHFQKVSGTSLFTSLKAITHFSRPQFPEIFKAVKEQYHFAKKIGVFTCGTPSLSASVEHGCRIVNRGSEEIIFKHYSENF